MVIGMALALILICSISAFFLSLCCFRLMRAKEDSNKSVAWRTEGPIIVVIVGCIPLCMFKIINSS